MIKDLFLVIGASGMVGSELVRKLKAAGHAVRSATSRTPTQKDQVPINLVTGEGIRDAFEGVDRAFFLAPPGYADQYELLAPLIQEAKRRGLKKVVLMTAMGANANEQSPLRRAERELESSGLTYNIIRPNWFLQNFQTFWHADIMKQDKILLPAGQAKVSFIDARDIAATAMVLLTNDQYSNRDFDLTGPESIDHAEVALALSRVAGRKIEYHETTEDEFRAGLLSVGVPKDYAEFLVLIMGFLRQGYSERRTSVVQEITGQVPRGLNEYVNDFAKLFKK